MKLPPCVRAPLAIVGVLAGPFVVGSVGCNVTLDAAMTADADVELVDAAGPPADSGDVYAASDADADADADAASDAGAHTWMSGFLMSAIVDDAYTAPSVDNGRDWYDHIGTWRTGSSRNNCKVFNANSYPDPGQANTILDYNFGTYDAKKNQWGFPARFVPSSVGLQPVWSTHLTRGFGYGLKDTISGNADPNYRTWFTKLVGYGQGNAIIRLGWELNGYWFPWGIGNATNVSDYGSVMGAAAAYKTAFRRVVDIARSIPGQAFTFEWNTAFLDADFGTVKVPGTAVVAAYPGGPDSKGRDYVDYVGIDAYDSSFAAGTPTLVHGAGSMASGSNVVTGWSGPGGRHFASVDVGKSIQVYKAGPAGSDAASFPLFATVVSVSTSANPPTATLDAPAVRAASGVTINLFDTWPSDAFTDPAQGIVPNLVAAAAFGRSKGKPLGISEWAPQLRLDGHGGNDDPHFIQVMYDFFADPANNVAYETLFQGIDGQIVYPMLKQAKGAKNGPFHDGTDALPRSVAKYHELFGPL